jgi:hypothetical protein
MQPRTQLAATHPPRWPRDLRRCSHFAKEAWLSPEGFPVNSPSTLTSSSRPGQ